MTASIVPFLRSYVFDAATTKAMGDAYDVAYKELDGVDRRHAVLLKEVIAKRIIRAAGRGERDPNRLSAKALDIRFEIAGIAEESLGASSSVRAR